MVYYLCCLIVSALSSARFWVNRFGSFPGLATENGSAFDDLLITKVVVTLSDSAAARGKLSQLMM